LLLQIIRSGSEPLVWETGSADASRIRNVANCGHSTDV